MTQNTNPWSRSPDPLVEDIAAVLKRMGGSAHQQDVVQCIAAMKRQRGETVAYEDFVALKGEARAREAGKLRAEGKAYVVKDGDMMNFLFN